MNELAVASPFMWRSFECGMGGENGWKASCAVEGASCVVLFPLDPFDDEGVGIIPVRFWPEVLPGRVAYEDGPPGVNGIPAETCCLGS